MLPSMKTNVAFYERTIKTFGGINICEDKKNGELYASENVTSLNFPAISSRKKRTQVYRSDRTINGIGGFEGLFYTSYSSDAKKIFLTFGGTDYEFTDFSSSKDFSSKREFAALTDDILIMPDKVIFSVSGKKFTKASFSYEQTCDTAKAKCRNELNGLSLINTENIEYIAVLEPDKISARIVNYTHSGLSKKFYYSSFPDNLKNGDVIVLKALSYSAYDESGDEYFKLVEKIYAGLTVKIKEIKKLSHPTVAGTISEVTEIIFENDIDLGKYTSLNVDRFIINRTVPSLNSICSFGNRIWGINDKKIYASKLSDASEWNDFTVDDYGTLPYASFSTAAQTEGKFTAVTPYGNYIYAFKENAIHKIFGDTPDEYVLHTEKCRGVGEGMADCLSVSASSIIYSSSDGIYVYRGDYPQKISENIGKMPDVISAAASEEYYYLLCAEDNEKFLYVYDISRNLWHRESADVSCTVLYSYANRVYMVAGNTIFCINPSENDSSCEKTVSWKFGLLIDDKLIEKKGYGKISLRYSLSKDASFTVRAIYDDGGRGAVCGARYDEAEGAGATLFLPVKRCNWFKLEFKGVGDFVLKAINLKFYRGSDI